MSADATAVIRDEAVAGAHSHEGYTVHWAASSEVGLVRPSNEDGAMVTPERYLVADGMGGHERGEVASEAVLVALADVVVGDLTPTRAAVLDALAAARASIESVDSESARQAGTTITGVMLVHYEGADHWMVLNVGDSRTYRWSDGTLEQVTVDHSQVQELVDAGYLTAEAARTDPRRNVITRAVGAGMDAEPDFFVFPVRAGESLLVCSDGLTGELPDEEIAQILADHLGPATDPAAVVADLVTATLQLGAHDNVTAVLAMVR